METQELTAAAKGRHSRKKIDDLKRSAFERAHPAYHQGSQAASHVVPKDTEIKVKTNTAIPAKPAANARFGATVSNDIKDGSGNVVIPRGSSALLVAVPAGKDTNLDLRSVTVNGVRYFLATQEKSSAPGGLGANKRTGKYVGGGAAIGAVMGAIFGGGKGAAIGALAGGAAGAGTQVYTGRKKELPPESELSFKLAQDLAMQPVAHKSGLQKRSGK